METEQSENRGWTNIKIDSSLIFILKVITFSIRTREKMPITHIFLIAIKLSYKTFFWVYVLFCRQCQRINICIMHPFNSIGTVCWWPRIGGVASAQCDIGHGRRILFVPNSPSVSWWLFSCCFCWIRSRVQPKVFWAKSTGIFICCQISFARPNSHRCAVEDGH